MFEAQYIILMLCVIVIKINCNIFEGYIVGGKLGPIRDYPHSVYLVVTCSDSKVSLCGGSILNQYIIMTAAHCLRICDYNQLNNIKINIGSTHKNKGIQKIKGEAYLVHEDYDEPLDLNDIGLIKVTPKIHFGSTVKRVAIMKTFPPHTTNAQVAGWGLIDEAHQVFTDNLQKLGQVLWTKRSCEKLYGDLPKGTVCASSHNDHSYVAPGDSGSALVVDGYIQIGIVSYKIPSVSNTLIVYTNVSYFYDWIAFNSRRLYCRSPV